MDRESLGPLMQIQWMSDDERNERPFLWAQTYGMHYYQSLGHELYTAYHLSGRLSCTIRAIAELPYRL